MYVPVPTPLKFCDVDPFDHKKVYGGVPPVGLLIVIPPSVYPLHETSVTKFTVTSTPVAGCPTIA